jgi:tetratricopeptide (TPR) repeat protein
VEIVRQDKFSQPSDRELLKKIVDEPLLVHQRQDGKKDIIIFVHGLGGRRYDSTWGWLPKFLKDSTWGRFPEFLYEDFPQLDVGLYEFRTLLRRAKFWESVSLSDEARVFAGIIRDIAGYETIILVGHSMGGLLCMAAITDLINTNQKKALLRIGGLILMATPQTGSQRVPTPLSWVSKDFRALRPHGEFVARLHETLTNHRVVLDETRAQAGDTVIPTWAVLGVSDHWVDSLSAGLHLPEERKRTVRGSHTAIVKPPSKRSDAYEYVRDRIREAFSLREAGAERAPRQPSLPWVPLAEAFENGEPHYFRLLRWNYRLVETLYGRERDLEEILKWAESNPRTPSARLITGEGGAGKTRLAATAAQILRDRAWTAGFIEPTGDPFGFTASPKGLFLILDYPEEKPKQTRALLQGLAERKTSPSPLRVLFVSRRSFTELEKETLLLDGRFGRQEIAAPSPLSVDDGAKLIEEAARSFATVAQKAQPDLREAKSWLEASDRHRLPLYATAAAIHAVLSPKDAFGLEEAHLLKDLALREIRRARGASKALGLGEEGLERLLALGVLADGLSQSAVTALAKAGICYGAKADTVAALSRSPWWKNGRLVRLEPDAPAAAFLDMALFGQSFPKGRDTLSDWLYVALEENAATFGNRLGRILYDLDALRSLRPKGEVTHPLDERLVGMVTERPERAASFASVASGEVPPWAANFAAHVAMIMGKRAVEPEKKAAYFNSASGYLSTVGRREEALGAAQEAVDLYRGLARARPEAFTPDLAGSLNSLANALARLGLYHEALAAAHEAVDIHRGLAHARPEAFTSDLAMPLNNLANVLAGLGRREEALGAAQEAVDLYRGLARARPEAFTPDLATSISNLVGRLAGLDRREEALGAAQEAVDLYRGLARARPEAFTPDLAGSLNNLASALAGLGKREEALGAAQEAVDLYRGLARARPEAFTPDLAMSLNNLATMLAELGRREEALGVAQAAVDLYRRLAHARPEAFTPELAGSLAILAVSLSGLGREEALGAAQEAVDLYRGPARARPEVFTPKLVGSLNILSAMLSALGRREEALAAAHEAADLLGKR